MDFIPDKELLLFWITQYGSFAIFALLAVGIIVFPIPEETLMVLAGILIHQGDLSLIPTAIAAYTGSMTGITGSYILGRLAGKYLLDKYGKWVGLTAEKQRLIHNWFEKYGKWTLSFGYFVPGIRHFTGFFAGMSRLEYSQFALFAYTGALIWASTFLSIGYFLGSYWLVLLGNIESNFDEIIITVIFLYIIFLIYRSLRKTPTDEGKMNFSISGQIVDPLNERIFSGTIHCAKGKIIRVVEEPTTETQYILPGLVDAHIHIESSMLVPSEFARMAVVHGTVATVSDPHEIGNVLGIAGVNYIIDNAKTVPLKFYFGAPSCVPATSFETAGATIGEDEIEELLASSDIHYLSEMMNYPGVIQKDPTVLAKIDAAKKAGKPIDGHAPGLRGKDLDAYIAAGISTDHESFTYEEGLEKLQKGMKLIIREGSAAKNFEALIALLPQYPDQVMFCSDDKHPDDLVHGHINQLLARAVTKGCDLMQVLRAATVNPMKHYRLEIGLLQVGDPATFITVSDLKSFSVLATYIDGKKVAEQGKPLFTAPKPAPVNHFNLTPISQDELVLKSSGNTLRVIQALEGEIITKELHLPAKIEQGNYVSDTNRDILKLVVINRYEKKPKPAIAFVHQFGLKKGAIASTVAHDSHNIIAVGADDFSLMNAINALVSCQGGITVAEGDQVHTVPLPVAGLMTSTDGWEVARQYEELNYLYKSMGGTLSAPFMTLSFLALLVIPELKLSDKGLFDAKRFQFVALGIEEGRRGT